MIHSENFDARDLTPNNYQFLITYKNVDNIKLGDVVYLKSCLMSKSDNPMEVVRFSYDFNRKCEKIICKTKNNNIEYSFYPWTILQLKYSTLLVYKRKFNICLN